MKKQKDLVAIIKSNPGCTAVIDNDNWRLMPAEPLNYEQMSDAERDEWHDNATLATARDEFKWPKGRGNFASCCYGGDILEALAIIAGINVESV